MGRLDFTFHRKFFSMTFACYSQAAITLIAILNFGCTVTVSHPKAATAASAAAAATPTATPSVSGRELSDLGDGIFESTCLSGTAESFLLSWKLESGISYAAVKHFTPNANCTGNYSLRNFNKGDPILNFEVVSSFTELNLSGLSVGFHITENTSIADSSLSYTPMYIVDSDHFQLLVNMDVNNVNFGAAKSDWISGSVDTFGFFLDPIGYTSTNGSNVALHRVRSLYPLDGTWEAPCTDMGSGNYGILKEIVVGNNAQVNIDFYGADATCTGTPVSNYLVTNHQVISDASISGVPNNFRAITSTDADHGNTQVRGAYYQVNPDEFYSYTTDPSNLTGTTWAQGLASNPGFASFAAAPTTPRAGMWHFTRVFDPAFDMSNGTAGALSQFFMMNSGFNYNSNTNLAFGKAGNGKGFLISIIDKVVHVDENLELDTEFGRGGVITFPSPAETLGGWGTANRLALSSNGYLIYPTAGTNGDMKINYYTSKGTTPTLVTAFDNDGSHEYPIPYPTKTPGQIVPLDSNDNFVFWSFSYDGGTGDAVSQFIKGGLAALFDLNFDTDGIVEVPIWQSTNQSFDAISSPSNMILTRFGWITASNGNLDPISTDFWNVAQHAWGFDGKIAFGITVQNNINNANTVRIVKAASDGNLDPTFGTAGISDIPLETATLLLNANTSNANFLHLANGKSVLVTSGSALKKADCNFDYSVCGTPKNTEYAIVISSTGTLENIIVYSLDTVDAYHLFSASSGNNALICYGNNLNAPFDSVDCAVHTY